MHLDLKDAVVPAEYAEMICTACTVNLNFLQCYSSLMIKSDVSKETLHDSVTDEDSSLIAKEEETSEGPPKKKFKMDDSVCKMPACEKDHIIKGPSFMKDGWRSQLCRCKKCHQIYKDLKVEYLFDSEDTVEHYENIGKAKAIEIHKESQELQDRVISSMDRVAQIELIHGMNNLRDGLRTFFHSFGEDHVITEADVRYFFSEMKKKDDANKGFGNPSHHCR